MGGADESHTTVGLIDPMWDLKKIKTAVDLR